MNDLPGLEGATVPMLPRERVNRTIGVVTSFDAGRGCPFLCSFCTIINVQGRKSRYRTADDVEAIVRANLAQGITLFLHHRRQPRPQPELGADLRPPDRDCVRRVSSSRFVMQVDTACHKIPRFIEKAGGRRASGVFIGLENINPDSLRRREEEAEPHRRLSRDAAGLAEGRAALTYCRLYPRLSRTTRRKSIVRDIEIIQRELPLDHPRSSSS